MQLACQVSLRSGWGFFWEGEGEGEGEVGVGVRASRDRAAIELAANNQNSWVQFPAWARVELNLGNLSTHHPWAGTLSRWSSLSTFYRTHTLEGDGGAVTQSDGGRGLKILFLSNSL